MKLNLYFVAVKIIDWAKQILDQYQLTEKCDILFSPVYQKLNATDLADWILKDQLHVRMQIQLHELLWRETGCLRP
jgi:7-carboxy-7-deazaguanine synthase